MGIKKYINQFIYFLEKQERNFNGRKVSRHCFYKNDGKIYFVSISVSEVIPGSQKDIDYQKLIGKQPSE